MRRTLLPSQPGILGSEVLFGYSRCWPQEGQSGSWFIDIRTSHPHSQLPPSVPPGARRRRLKLRDDAMFVPAWKCVVGPNPKGIRLGRSGLRRPRNQAGIRARVRAGTWLVAGWLPQRPPPAVKLVACARGVSLGRRGEEEGQ